MNRSFGESALSRHDLTDEDRKAIEEANKWSAAIIDQMNDLRSSTASNEQKRLASIAITELQGAQMWAVKALTWKD